jgi:5'-3' exonuclease
MSNQHIVLIDGMNFLHRARSGFTVGEHFVVYNFFRNFRSLVEQLNPSRIYFILEGRPHRRFDVFPEYKANRLLQEEDPEKEAKQASLDSFYRQANVVIDMLKETFPVAVMRHSDYECDDVIHNVIKNASSMVNFTVVSSDSDMTQLLCDFLNVQVYNPIKKEYLVRPKYDYVMWKSLRGDVADNIPGIPGATEEVALQLASNPDELPQWLKDHDAEAQFARNYRLIKFFDLSKEELLKITSSSPRRRWTDVYSQFESMQFKSLLVEKTWKKFVDTFDSLFAE